MPDSSGQVRGEWMTLVDSCFHPRPVCSQGRLPGWWASLCWRVGKLVLMTRLLVKKEKEKEKGENVQASAVLTGKWYDDYGDGDGDGDGDGSDRHVCAVCAGCLVPTLR